MYEELLTQLLPVFIESGEINEETEVDIDGNILKITINKEEDENKIVMTVEYKEDEFKKYVDSLDEDIFIEACEKFESKTGIPLNDDVDKDLFKEVVRQIIAEKINKLRALL